MINNIKHLLVFNNLIFLKVKKLKTLELTEEEVPSLDKFPRQG
jgi:hypothetical protein